MKLFQSVSKFRARATLVIGTKSNLMCCCNLEIQFVFTAITQRSILLISSQLIHLIFLENNRKSKVFWCFQELGYNMEKLGYKMGTKVAKVAIIYKLVNWFAEQISGFYVIAFNELSFVRLSEDCANLQLCFHIFLILVCVGCKEWRAHVADKIHYPKW